LNIFGLVSDLWSFSEWPAGINSICTFRLTFAFASTLNFFFLCTLTYSEMGAHDSNVGPGRSHLSADVAKALLSTDSDDEK